MKNLKLRTKIILSSLAMLIAISVICFAVMASGDNIYKGISVAGVYVGGMTPEKASSELSSVIKVDSLPAFVCGEREFSISPETISLRCDNVASAKMAHDYGRDGNMFSRFGNIFNVMFHPVDLPPVIVYDESKLDSELDKYIGDLRNPSAKPKIRIEGDRLYIINGREGVDVNREKLNDSLVRAVMENNEKIEVMVETVSPVTISAQMLYDDYARPATNAQYSISGKHIVYTQSETGVDFDIAVAEKIIAENIANPDEYFIPITITQPNVTAEMLDSSMFGDLLGTYTSMYNPNEIGRTKNVTLASGSINNVVLASGEEFSYNAIVGERTPERGFSDAKVYAMGEVVDGMGGGVCQVSSTLYNAVLYADLEVVSRTAHSLPVTYVPLGRDATVSYGSIDFVFRNSYPHAIKITSAVGGGKLTVSIYGKKTTNKDVEIITERVSTSYFSVVEKIDDNVAKGTTRVKQAGSNGGAVNTYVKITENGKTTTRFLHKSYYNPINKVVLVPPPVTLPAPAPREETPVDEKTPINPESDSDSPENLEKEENVSSAETAEPTVSLLE